MFIYLHFKIVRAEYRKETFMEYSYRTCLQQDTNTNKLNFGVKNAIHCVNYPINAFLITNTV